jgi:putative transposase
VMLRRTFKYRLYPHRRQREKLQATLDVCRELYNAALQERREAWSSHRKSIDYVAQAKQLGEIKTIREDLRALHSQVLQDALRRIDKAFQAFFLRCRRGQVPGFPRFRSQSRYDSFTYPQTGFKLSGRLTLSKIGDLKMKLHRPIQGQIKTLTIKRENGMWYACFSCVVEAELLPANAKAVGLDVGLSSFVVPSDGRGIGNPRWYQIVNHYGLIFVEDLNVKGLSRGWLSKSVHDAGWAAFFQKLSYKAESAGRWFLPVDARGTSQRCPCGEPNLKRLSNREHVCVKCGLVTTRDHASAMEILRLGLSLQSRTAVQ